MTQRFSRFFATALLALFAVTMLSASFDAEARRFGGGRSLGMQSPRVIKNQPAAKAPSAAQRSATPAAAGAAGKTGASRFLGPIAGIAAGLGIAALLSHLGMGGAFLEMMSSLILIALLVFAVIFIVRRLRGMGGAATQGAGGMQRQADTGQSGGGSYAQPLNPAPSTAASWSTTQEPSEAGAGAAPTEGWFIPEGFDTAAFLAQAKKQFVAIQAIWDRADLDELAGVLTDDLLAEFRPEIEAREGRPEHTEVVLLNAELLGIEAVAGGHLASVRFSGMLREAVGAEASRFEEIWNLYKADNAGWLLAGLQQRRPQEPN